MLECTLSRYDDEWWRIRIIISRNINVNRWRYGISFVITRVPEKVWAIGDGTLFLITKEIRSHEFR